MYTPQEEHESQTEAEWNEQELSGEEAMEISNAMTTIAKLGKDMSFKLVGEVQKETHEMIFNSILQSA